MEFIDGVACSSFASRARQRTAQKLELLAQAAEGLAAVHAAGFIHHDINPRNFLVDREQHVKLIDFGLTVPNTPAFCRPGNRTGTLQYMAPELLRREPIDERIDMFAFGVLAFEFLTDRLPYDATNSTTMMLQRINTRTARPRRRQTQAVRRTVRHPPPVDRPAQGTALAGHEARCRMHCAAIPAKRQDELVRIRTASRL